MPIIRNHSLDVTMRRLVFFLPYVYHKLVFYCLLWLSWIILYAEVLFPHLYHLAAGAVTAGMQMRVRNPLKLLTAMLPTSHRFSRRRIDEGVICLTSALGGTVYMDVYKNMPRIERPHPNESGGEPICHCCPPQMSGHRLAIIGGYAYVYGGLFQRSQDQEFRLSTYVWRFCLLNNTWKKIPLLQEVYHMTPVSYAWVVTRKWGILTFGGTGFPFGTRNGDKLCQLTFLHRDKSDSYTIFPLQSSGESLPGCYGAVLIPDEQNNCVYLMGGTDGREYFSHVYRGDISVVDSQKHVKWQRISSPADMVSGRYRHEGVLYDDKLLFFGGGNSDALHSVSEITTFDLKTNQFHVIQAIPDPEHGKPPDRDCFSLVRAGQKVYLLGGRAQPDGRLLLDDIWVFNLENYSWTKHHMRLHFQTAFNGADVDQEGRIYVFGGHRANANSIGRTNLMQSFLAQPPSLKMICSQYYAQLYKGGITFEDSDLRSAYDFVRKLMSHFADVNAQAG